MSDPSIEDDGYDLVCGGVMLEKGLVYDVAGCKNVRGGEMLRVDVRWIGE